MNEPKPLPAPDDASRKRIARVDVRGKSVWTKAGRRALIQSLRQQVAEVADTVLDTQIGEDPTDTVREEAKKFTREALEAARHRLQREGLENDEIEAGIADLYAAKQVKVAEASLTRAKAAEVRRATDLKKLCAKLAMTQAIILGEEDEEAIAFGKRITVFLQTVRELGLLSSENV